MSHLSPQIRRLKKEELVKRRKEGNIVPPEFVQLCKTSPMPLGYEPVALTRQDQPPASPLSNYNMTASKGCIEEKRSLVELLQDPRFQTELLHDSCFDNNASSSYDDKESDMISIGSLTDLSFDDFECAMKDLLW